MTDGERDSFDQMYSNKRKAVKAQYRKKLEACKTDEDRKKAREEWVTKSYQLENEYLNIVEED